MWAVDGREVGCDEGGRVEAGVGRSDGSTVESDGREVGHRDGDGDGGGDDWAVRVGEALCPHWVVQWAARWAVQWAARWALGWG